ncbi:hypothetical protein DOTSEDRAFT_70257 [Dothistroma septosporum NZE10]|uniref:Uncharacterized protein n=1 Tax=Dothistroma septosporum (strain NZE10 / CBS 128990) TaxID=675120 RepID=N1PUX6_DOTSN|nr:hypothetical protein DOTSEDRAFT_70257 [Dothistroma septosporum NZE10]
MAKETKGAKVSVDTLNASDGETRPANRLNRRAALFDLSISILPLYFVAFAFLAYSRTGTLASSPLDQDIFRMAAFNPTVFPILFTLICAKFIKAVANFKLERGATVGAIQHLLGSRSLVTAITTPFKLHDLGVVPFVVIVVWALNPLGGQMALRVASYGSNYTTVSADFDYIDMNNSPFQLLDSPNRLSPINAAFNTALMSPATSKNGSEDMYGNVQIPMLESLKQSQKADSDGWYRTGQLARVNDTSTSADVLEGFIGIPNDADTNLGIPTPVYISLTGVPFSWNSSLPEQDHPMLNNVQVAPQGSGKEVNLESQFNFETSYFSVDCSVAQAGTARSGDSFAQGINTATGVVSNDHQFVVSYDFNHTINSTAPRQIELTSWNGHSRRPGDEVSKASCQLTTTYVEAAVYCASSDNCSVVAMRESLLDHPKPALSQLDGIAPSWNLTSNMTQAQRHAIPELFFSGFMNASGNLTQDTNGLSPIECYFMHPEDPYQCSTDATGQYALYTIGDELFSTRFTQLLNTYWMANVAPYSMTGSFTPNNTFEGSIAATTSGQIRIETIVLRCNVPFMIILVAISIALCLAGMATAYLDATRRGPDILDNFASSLRYNPYVHVEAGSGMDDGLKRTRRLRSTFVQLGDVRPEDPVGVVAVGTPTWKQPMRMLQHDRQYR